MAKAELYIGEAFENFLALFIKLNYKRVMSLKKIIIVMLYAIAITLFSTLLEYFKEGGGSTYPRVYNAWIVKNIS